MILRIVVGRLVLNYGLVMNILNGLDLGVSAMNKLFLTVLILMITGIIIIWEQSKSMIIWTLLISAGLMTILLIDEIIKQRKQ